MGTAEDQGISSPVGGSFNPNAAPFTPRSRSMHAPADAQSQGSDYQSSQEFAEMDSAGSISSASYVTSRSRPGLSPLISPGSPTPRQSKHESNQGFASAGLRGYSDAHPENVLGKGVPAWPMDTPTAGTITSRKTFERSETESESSQLRDAGVVRSPNANQTLSPLRPRSFSFSSDEFSTESSQDFLGDLPSLPTSNNQAPLGQAAHSAPGLQNTGNGQQPPAPVLHSPWAHLHCHDENPQPALGENPGFRVPSTAPSLPSAAQSVSSRSSTASRNRRPHVPRMAPVHGRAFQRAYPSQPTGPGPYHVLYPTPYQQQAYQAPVARPSSQPFAYGSRAGTPLYSTNQVPSGYYYGAGFQPFGNHLSGYQAVGSYLAGHQAVGTQQNGYLGQSNQHTGFPAYGQLPFSYQPNAPYAGTSVHQVPQPLQGPVQAPALLPPARAPSATLGYPQASQWFYTDSTKPPAPAHSQAYPQIQHQAPPHPTHHPSPQLPPQTSAQAPAQPVSKVLSSPPPSVAVHTSSSNRRRVPPRSGQVIPRQPINRHAHQGPIPSAADVYPEDSSHPSSDVSNGSVGDEEEQSHSHQTMNIYSPQPIRQHSPPEYLRQSPPVWTLPRTITVPSTTAIPAAPIPDTSKTLSNRLLVPPSSSANNKARDLGILAQLTPSVPSAAEIRRGHSSTQKTTPTKQDYNSTRRARAAVQMPRIVPAVPRARGGTQSSKRSPEKARSDSIASSSKIQLQPSPNVVRRAPATNVEQFQAAKVEWPALPGTQPDEQVSTATTVLSTSKPDDPDATPTALHPVTARVQASGVEPLSAGSSATLRPTRLLEQAAPVTHPGPWNPAGHKQTSAPPGFADHHGPIARPPGLIGRPPPTSAASPILTYLRPSDLFLDEVTGESPPWIPLSHDQVTRPRPSSPQLPGCYEPDPRPLTQDQIDGSKYGLSDRWSGMGNGADWNPPTVVSGNRFALAWKKGWDAAVDAGF
ncbi:hypothetical protein P154DRAFT_188466 [Amniculicola lignicola CBS 123094]|uniref:Uncharacterized protein n=1 Tax=Amniculicola lignicola CBS 123094 TaxID=1392246 RepID=A0A6A5WIG0_9PLEO|nr:hypothetical protein P154DRAFT_188466 [Amniculicola lignicola CBS 123094]